MKIGFNYPKLAGRELDYIRQAVENRHLSGDGPFSKRCESWLEAATGSARALLTHSCTAALEMAALLCDLTPGDEVIMPAFTFVSTANAVALRGAIPVFVDIRPDTLNLDESLIARAITPRTKAIFVVHYAGVGCAMDEIMAIADRHGLVVVEDAAQALMTTYRGRPLGGIGQLAAISFHETKNVISGEGGALLVNDPGLAARAEILREKGTNRSSFFRGEVDKYSWVDLGSSYLPSEIVAAFLYAQLEAAEALTEPRKKAWQTYHAAFQPLEADGLLRRPVVPAECEHNGHIYYLLMPSLEERLALGRSLKARRIDGPFHYVPLDTAPAGRRFGRACGDLPVTHQVADRLLRLPLWSGMDKEPEIVAAAVIDHCLGNGAGA
ncbi:MAG: dTDP-4-amino-4,6-dideoxygalactose transaminase [Alphaproteobacteria bacterium]|nr:dTDP-4-amino-4,6-dideoxygalactose transaminase [Alphaproteobacteria bacterium]